MKAKSIMMVLCAVLITLSSATCRNAGKKERYRKVNSVAELLDNTWMYNVDLSSLDLRNHGDLFMGKTNFGEKVVLQWTDRVIWPDASKMPEGFNPQQLLEESKKPEGVAGLHAKWITGKGVKIAIIDQRLYREHPEYKDRIKHYEVFGDNWDPEGADYHGSLVTGISVGRNTGTAPDAEIYYFAANNWPDNWQNDKSQPLAMRTINKAIRKIIEMNKTLPENKKIRFLSCSFGDYDDSFADEREKLFDEAEKNGIMVLGGFYKHTLRGVFPMDKRYGSDETGLGIPSDGKTNPYFLGGYAFDRLGGTSSMLPYLAGVFALALQDNIEFTRLPDWQSKLMRIAFDTAVDGVVNPEGIVAEVSRIAKTLAN